MERLRKMAFLALHNQPTQRQGALVPDDIDHECHATTSNDAAVDGKQERLVGQIAQQGLSDGKKPGISGVGIVGEPAPKAFDEAFLIGGVGRSMVGDGREVGAACADKTADQGGKGVEVSFTMTGEGWKVLHECLLYGTIASIRVTHVFL
ncbi:MAG: hypothetical protein AVDCRST_MAG93-1648 [uncultured Chloroflexia bacterium]|uniref:Uncharacterized protein n=1 Tax=uncultured Chloroflexia bacterium TaxID=1672391 RepID=A0A6J4IEK3_9CHLR|nr:MAG: hypothetical protein AVDCRST_MAG93-1648 [uncultured Chloroflexia bacterium]